MSEVEYVLKFDKNLMRFFRSALLRTRFKPTNLQFLIKTCRDQKEAIRKRSAWSEKGLQVPPLMIISITNRCNLQCRGCYAHAIHPEKDSQEISDKRLYELGDEAEELGISIILIAGGEPLLRPVFFDLAKRHPNILFLVFTNGLLINEVNLALFKNISNLLPVLSLEGQQAETDFRRGDGIYALVQQKMGLLAREGILFGTSLTITNQNYDLITSTGFQKDLATKGSQVTFFVEYVPVKTGTEELVIGHEQKASLPGKMRLLRQQIPGLFVCLPGDEDIYGGCLAAGRGFIHVNPKGRLEPCPFAPFSDTDISTLSLKEALASDFLRLIRENANSLKESEGGCTLWENRDWVLKQMHSSKA
jgi:MoaA/NifB/PqqE/SkfB family radical SAM enzyme